MQHFQTCQDGNVLLISFISVDWLVLAHFDRSVATSLFLCLHIAAVFAGIGVAVFQHDLELFLFQGQVTQKKLLIFIHYVYQYNYSTKKKFTELDYSKQLPMPLRAYPLSLMVYYRFSCILGGAVSKYKIVCL